MFCNYFVPFLKKLYIDLKKSLNFTLSGFLIQSSLPMKKKQNKNGWSHEPRFLSFCNKSAPFVLVLCNLSGPRNCFLLYDVWHAVHDNVRSKIFTSAVEVAGFKSLSFFFFCKDVSKMFCFFLLFYLPLFVPWPHWATFSNLLNFTNLNKLKRFTIFWK